jgi:hypothetical protein
MRIVLAQWASAERGDPCPECGQPLETAIRSIHRRTGEAFGPVQFECASGHAYLDVSEPIADMTFPVRVADR